ARRGAGAAAGNWGAAAGPVPAVRGAAVRSRCPISTTAPRERRPRRNVSIPFGRPLRVPPGASGFPALAERGEYDPTPPGRPNTSDGYKEVTLRVGEPRAPARGWVSNLAPWGRGWRSLDAWRGGWASATADA